MNVNMKKASSISSKRITKMFLAGSDSKELSKCLSESKLKLIQARVKVDNVPIKRDQVMKFINGLTSPVINPKINILRDWYLKKANFEPSDLDLIKAIELIKKSENLSKPETKNEDEDENEEVKSLWRLLLSNYVSSEISPEVIEFLKASDINDIEKLEEYENVEEKEEIYALDHELSLALIDSEHKNITDLLLPKFKDGVIAAIEGKKEVVLERKNDINKIPTFLSESFSEILSTVEVRATKKRNQGIHVKKTSRFKLKHTEDIHKWPILGSVKSCLPSGQIFVKVIGVFVDNILMELENDEAKEFYPFTGDVVALHGTLKEHHSEDELSIWKVEYGSSDKKTQYVIKEHISRVFDVLKLPHSSYEPDNVRNWLKKEYHYRSSVYPVFELNDGLILKFPNGSNDPSKFNYDLLLDGYNSLIATEMLSGRQILVNQFPSPDFKYDCAPITTWVKRVFKARAEVNNFPPFSKAQLNSLVEYVGLESEEFLSHSLDRVRSRLEEVPSSKEALDLIVEHAVQLPEFIEEIEKRKSEVLLKFQEDKANEKNALDELLKQKKSVKLEIEKLKKSNKDQNQDLALQIKKTYERASIEGMSTLANSSLLQTLFPHLKINETINTLDPEKTVISYSINEKSEIINSIKELNRKIRDSSMESGLSPLIIKSVIAAAKASGVVGLIGRRSPFISSIISDIVADGVSIEVSVTCDMFGISDLMRSAGRVKYKDNIYSHFLGDFIEHQQQMGKPIVVELRGLNRAPPETFLPEIFDLCFDGHYPSEIVWTDKSGALRKTKFPLQSIFLLNFVSGKAIFALPRSLSIDIPIIYTDIRLDDETLPISEIGRKYSYVSENVWRELIPNIDENQRVTLGQRYLDSMEKRMESAIKNIGEEIYYSDVLSKLSYRCGRQNITALADEIENLAPILTPYINSLENGDARELLNHIFQCE